MKALLLLPALFLYCGAQHFDAEKLTEKVFEGQTEAQVNEMWCIAFYCHFEERNGCKIECIKFGKSYRAVEGVREFSVNKDQLECEQKCIPVTHYSADPKKLCTSLCSTHFSLPNRKEYEEEIVKFVE